MSKEDSERVRGVGVGRLKRVKKGVETQRERGWKQRDRQRYRERQTDRQRKRERGVEREKEKGWKERKGWRERG